MVRVIAVLSVLSAVMLGSGCTTYPTFGFPVEQGDIEAGQQVFVSQGCLRCHTVAGMSLPDFPGASTPRIELGGETSQVKAYSELVTSIINPNHRISERYREQLLQPPSGPLESPMPSSYIETMTVRQLIDLVAFLDSRYILIDEYQTDLGMSADEDDPFAP